MRVRTAQAQEFDFSLSGRECQSSFNLDKYKALVGGSPKGIGLRIAVENKWTQWLEIVENAPWLRNWVRSKYYNPNSIPRTPCGRQVLGIYSRHNIAHAIYAEAVWGFGMQNWLRDYKEAMNTIWKLQNVRKPSIARTYMWDDILYRGCGLMLPCEVGDLDRWLEPIWQDVLAQNKV